MRRIILYLATSIDGYIARRDGSVDWLSTEADLGEYSFTGFLARTDTIIMGRTSYEQTLTFGDWAFASHRTCVLTSRSFQPSTPATEGISDDQAGFIRRLKEEPGKDIWCFGGGRLNAFLLQEDLIDELMIFIQPVTLGDGIGLFGNATMPVRRFRRREVVPLGDGFTLLWFERQETPAAAL